MRCKITATGAPRSFEGQWCSAFGEWVKGTGVTPSPFFAEHVSLEDREEKKKKYVAKDPRQKSWLETYLWLSLTGKSNEKGHARGLCKLCCEHCPKVSMFAGQGDGHGAVIQDANVLRDHEGSAHHTAAVKKATTLSGGVGSISHGMKAISKHVNVATQGILPLLIMAAFWLVKEHVAGIKFASLLEFLTMAGVQGISKKYNNRRYFWSGLYACSEFLLCNVVTKVMMSPYFALLCDRGTDITTENHMLVYIRYLGMLSYSFVTTYAALMSMLMILRTTLRCCWVL